MSGKQQYWFRGQRVCISNDAGTHLEVLVLEGVHAGETWTVMRSELAPAV